MKVYSIHLAHRSKKLVCINVSRPATTVIELSKKKGGGAVKKMCHAVINPFAACPLVRIDT